jgi:selenocysteine-specific elongation factor
MVLFLPDEPVYALVGDHYILRLPTPMVTLGGGRIVDHLPQLPRRRDWTRYGYLQERAEFSITATVLTELKKRIMAPEDSLLSEADLSAEGVRAESERLLKSGEIGRSGGHLYHVGTVDRVAEKTCAELKSRFEDSPHLKGLPYEEMTSILGLPAPTVRPLLDYLVSRSVLERRAELYDLAGRGMSLKGVIKQAYEEIMATLKAEPYTPPTLGQLAARGKNHQHAIKYILDSGEGYKCGSEFIYLTEIWDEITGFIRDRLNADGKLNVPELRDRFSFTRKFAIPILEECDRIGLTAREGDYRIKGDKFG